ncbi:hypothetical protein FACS1894216_03200 [Synergistales bacterium]|nr:hypothetical protein FACS1894216_03200 [Synergistales bacterium]
MAEPTSLKKGGSAPSAEKLEQRAKLMRVGIIVVLFCCCALSFYFFAVSMNLFGLGDRAAAAAAANRANTPLPSEALLKEADEIAVTASSLTGVANSEKTARDTALFAEVSGKYPVAAASALMTTESSAPIVLTDGSPPPDPEPSVTVSAVMLMGGESMAMINVDNVEGGGSELIVKKGAKFANGKAIVTKIDSTGVTYTWKKKSRRSEIEQ